MEILKGAINEAFDGTANVVELDRQNIRSRVRLSVRSVETVLVVLDGVSSDTCKDIENGLYSSDKYYEYTSDKELVVFLNSKYGLNLKYVEEEPETFEENNGVSEVDISELEREFSEKLKLKDDIIFSLECRIKDMTNFYGEFDSEKAKKDTGELIKLKDEVLDLKSLLESEKRKKANLDDRVGSLIRTKKEYEIKLDGMQKELDEVTVERNELRVDISRQNNVIRTNSNKLEELKSEKKTIEKKLEVLSSEIVSLKDELSEKSSEVDNLRADLRTKSDEITGYLRELDGLRKYEGLGSELKASKVTIENLRTDLSSLRDENNSMRKESSNKDRTISQLTKNNERSLEEIETLKANISELKERVKSDDNSISLLNQEKLKLHSEVDTLKRASGSSDSTESFMVEIQNLQNRISELSSSVFSIIGSHALPNKPVGCNMLGGTRNYKSIKFAFSGSTESRRGTYRQLQREIISSGSNMKYLFVDAVSEPYSDYVFSIKRPKAGVEWFSRGGSLSGYLSDTSMDNLKVLMLGLKYVNDSYLLCVDWVKRLRELNESGYNVVLYCGDISNTIGRVLHESFASYGVASIYTVGTVVSMRALYSNLGGIPNSKDSDIRIFDYNKAAQRYCDVIAKTNRVSILSIKDR